MKNCIDMVGMTVDDAKNLTTKKIWDGEQNQLLWCDRCGVTYEDNNERCKNCQVSLQSTTVMKEICWYGDYIDVQMSINRENELEFMAINREGKKDRESNRMSQKRRST